MELLFSSLLHPPLPSSFPSASDPPAPLPLGPREAHYLTVLSQPCQPGLAGVVLCHHARPALHQWHQAVLKPTRSSLINITPVPLRTAAPSILRCTPALRDVTARLLAVSAHRVSSSVFSFLLLRLLSPPNTMDLSRPFLHFGSTSEPRILANPPWPL